MTSNNVWYVQIPGCYFKLILVTVIIICLIFLFCLGSRFHDFHHFNFVGNYAPTFRWWDWMMGTDEQWQEHEKARLAKGKVD